MLGLLRLKEHSTLRRAGGGLTRWVFGAALALCVASLPYGRVLAAQDGEITSLTAVNTGNTVTVSITIYALPGGNGVQTSSLYFEIVYGGTVYRTHTVDNQTVPTLNPGDSWTYSWTTDITTSPSFPVQGNYTLNACWAYGNSSANGNNCAADAASTTFYSAPTLGVWFGAAAVASIAVILWRRRADFIAGQVKP